MELTYRYGVFTAFVANLMAERIFRIWIRSIFHGQNTWKTECVFDMTLVFGNVCMIGMTFQRCLRPKTISYFRAPKAPKKPYRYSLTFRRLPIPKARVENGTNGFLFTAFDGVNVQASASTVGIEWGVCGTM